MMSFPATLYRYYDVDGVLLYVGVSFEANERLVQHRKSKDWYYEIKYIRLDHYLLRHEAMQAEHQAIEIEKPRYNRTPRSRGRVSVKR